MRNKKIKILEIGVLYGSSLRMWQDYFSKAEIYGMDVIENCKNMKTIESK